MVDPLSRRDAIAQGLLGVAATHQPMTPANMLLSASPQAAHVENGDITMIGLFMKAGSRDIPPDSDLVETSGYAVIGQGSARYVHDPRIDAAYVKANPRTSFMSANDRGFRLVETAAVDVRQVGASGDGAKDDTAALQSALDIVETAGGGIVILPAGQYKITSTLNLPGKVGIEGQGQFSVLRVYGCDGINIRASNVIGPRRLANLWIYGSNSERFSGIICNLSSKDRAQGLIFDNIYISFFGNGVKSRGLWHATFRRITINQVWYGFYFYDRNVKITIDDCHITQGGLIQLNGYSIGIQVGDANYSLRPEDVQIDKSIVYGFWKGIVWRTALFGGVTNSDLDACINTGLEIVTADGGFVFRDNWIQLIGSDGKIYGINGVALGYTPQLSNIAITNNRITAPTVRGGGVGIFLGSNQANMTINGNSVVGGWTEGIRADGVHQVSFTDNKVASTFWLGNSENVALRDNYVPHGIALVSNKNLSLGMNFGPSGTKR